MRYELPDRRQWGDKPAPPHAFWRGVINGAFLTLGLAMIGWALWTFYGMIRL